VDGTHVRADQALNVAAIARRCWRTPIDVDAMFFAAPAKGLAVELGAVVDMDGPRQAHGRPCGGDAKRLQRRRLVEDGVQEA